MVWICYAFTFYNICLNSLKLLFFGEITISPTFLEFSLGTGFGFTCF